MDLRTVQPCGELSFDQQDAHHYRMRTFWSDEMPWHPRAAMPPNALGNHAELDYDPLGPQFQIFQSHPTFSECDTFPQDSAYGSGPTIPESVPSLYNFRSHLNRQHPDLFKVDDDLQAYIYRHPEASRSDLQGVGQGIWPLDVDISQVLPFLEDEQALPDDNPTDSASQESELTFGSDCGQANSYHEWSQSLDDLFMASHPNAANEIIPESFPDLADDFSNDSANDVASESLESPAEPHPQDDLVLEEVPDKEDFLDDLSRENGAWAAPDLVLKAQSLDMDGWGSELSESDHATEETAPGLTADVLEKSLREAQPHTSRIIRILQSLPPQLLKTALRRDQESEDEDAEREEDKPNVKDKAKAQSSPRANHKCPECPKAFGRLCELKKHSKRHAKPYGCTFKECDKTFGSKNDWKRHESNQHSTLETWTCDMPGCHVVRHRQETFRSHLLKDHHLSHQPKLVEEKLERCRMGRHCDPRFWCGFCVEVIEIMEAGVNAWRMRCDHIDNHLWGKEGLIKKKMEDWVYVNDGKNRPGGGENGAVQTGGKRKASDAQEKPLNKKQKEGSLMWYCCNCPNAAGAVLKLSSSCLECHHLKCLHCTQEMVTTED
ncbi:Zinc finger protein GLIS2 [Escovopsis weberi]|uniref:Zinc finger protein GLIS2 n=1 Tax=Escovopsis weberi TaxID=150374 RepID=A0A0M8MZS3_ESCWE|nr:Zinc finger protein GLIS2 [Escovopsis weberi]